MSPSFARDSATAPDTFVFAVSAEEAGGRLDRFVTGKVESLSRARARALIESGAVLVTGQRADDPNRRLKSGDEVRVVLPPPEPARAAPEANPLNVRYEDAHLLVLDKPAGIVVHPAPGHAAGTLVNALIAHCGASLSGIGGEKRPGIVHRLDKDTSGLLVVAKTEAAHHGLAAQFAAHGADGKLHRAYLAVCWGVPARRSAVIEARIGRSSANRKKMTVVGANAGRTALTRYAALEMFAGASGEPVASLVRLELATGRTHQIRVHLAHIGHPLLGDAAYGAGFKTRANLLTGRAEEALRALARQALHAAELGFEHPATGVSMRFESPPPADLAQLIEALRAAKSTDLRCGRR